MSHTPPRSPLHTLLCTLLRCCPPPGRAVALRFSLHPPYPPGEGVALITLDPGGSQMLTLTTAQFAALQIAPTDAAGKPTTLDGIPSWQLSDPTLGTLQTAPDNLSALFTPSAAGTATVVVTGQPFGGGPALTQSLDLTITVPQPTPATALNLTGQVLDAPPTPPQP